MNFAHGEMAMLGAYFYYLFYITLAWPVLPSILAALASCVVCGLLINKIIFSPMKRESQWTLLILSVGVGMFIKSAVQLIAGSFTLNFVRETYTPTVYAGAGITITQNQIMVLVSTAAILLGLHFLLTKTRLGKAIRAVSDNMQLASVVGIGVNRTISWIFVISSSIAGFAGILIGYEQSLSPNMGQMLSVYAFAAVIVGGLGSVWGAVLGGFLVGILQDLLVGIDFGIFSIPTSYKSAIAFGLVMVFLLLRPRGLFGISLEEDKTSKA